MSAELVELVYTERDNAIDLELREDGVAVNLAALTRARLELFEDVESPGAPIVVDSTITPTAFDWATLGSSGVLRLVLGALVVAGTYNARLVLYDATNTAGIVWAHETKSGTRLIIRALAAEDAA